MDSLLTKEIIQGEKLKDRLLSGVQKMAQAVVVTMGPFGKTVIITSAYDAPYVTKDGVSVARKIYLEDPVENIAAELLKEAAEKTLSKVGDGTTTSIVVAAELVKIGYSLMKHGMPFRELKELVEKFIGEVIISLEESARPMTKEAVYDVATISANGDQRIADIVSQAFQHAPVVKVYQGNQEHDVLDLINGMQLDCTYADKAFINKMEKQSVFFDEPFRVILIDGKLTDLSPISTILSTYGKNFVIFADFFGDDVLSILKDNYNRGALNAIPVKSPGFGQNRKDLLNDIAFFTGASVIKTRSDNTSKVLGLIDKLEITPNRTLLTSSKIELDRANELKQYSETLEDGHTKDSITRRIEALGGKVSAIHVGGITEAEMKERFDRMEDAVRAVQSAKEEGIVEGGGVALVRAYNQLINKEDTNSELAHVILSPSYSIYVNSEGKINKDWDESRFDQKIVDPLKVTKYALQNAVSVALTILSTEAVVLDKSLWK